MRQEIDGVSRCEDGKAGPDVPGSTSVESGTPGTIRPRPESRSLPVPDRFAFAEATPLAYELARNCLEGQKMLGSIADVARRRAMEDLQAVARVLGCEVIPLIEETAR